MQIVLSALDLETTGFESSKGHRITEVGLVMYRYDTETGTAERVRRFSFLVNPLRDIPAIVQSLTHITPAMVAGQKTWDEVAPAMAKAMAMTDILIAHNADFDSTFLTEELERVGQPMNLDLMVFCTMQNGRFATPLGKVPKLTELCWALGVPFDEADAHRAIYDVEKMMEAFFLAVDRGYFQLDGEFAAIAAQRAAKESVHEATTTL